MAEQSTLDREGTEPRCTTCNRIKEPIGRSVPMALSGSMCNRDCRGYEGAPLADTLWPGEKQSEFGYGCIYAPGHDGDCEYAPHGQS